MHVKVSIRNIVFDIGILVIMYMLLVVCSVEFPNEKSLMPRAQLAAI